ncbi:DUF5615 family PIN-like protein [bacterium]|nr:MAG: DUF5615 family PIN-like protein [bacterium]
MSPIRRTPKPKLLLDEGFRPRKSFSELNGYFDVKHIAHDLSKSGASDTEVYAIATATGRIVVTHNPRDFKPLISDVTASVIGVSMKLDPDKVGAKLVRLAKEIRPKQHRGCYWALGAR